MPARVSRHYHDHAHGEQLGTVRLTYDARFLRRKMLTTLDGEAILVDLAQTTSLDHGGVLVLEGGGEILVEAAEEELLEVRSDCLHRLAWHIGNRHTPCQIEADRLLIQTDHVLQDMLQKLGADLRFVTEPFTPDRGAYGHGRTHSHDHGHSHHTAGNHDEGHAHEH